MTIKRIFSYNLLPYYVLLIFFLINLYIFWPGQMNSDSISQYKAAITGVYFDHHPPMMSLLWRFLDHVIPGPGLILLFHLLMLYGACFIFMLCFETYSKLKWFYVLMPIWPSISFYSFMIWKDAGFAFSFLLASAILSYFMVNKKHPNLLIILFILVLLFYGTGVKYQAMFVLPFMVTGLAYVSNNFKFNFNFFLIGIGLYLMIFGLVDKLNNYFVPESQKNHSWQYVKLYDLTAISLKTNEPLFPEFVIKNPNFSMESVKSKYNIDRVDDLVFFEGSPLKKGETPQERQEVLNYWKTNVLKYPSFYLQHRFNIWKNTILSMPFKQLETLDFSHWNSLSWLDWLFKSKAFHIFIEIFRYLLSFILLLPLIIFYFILSLFYLNKRRFALPLFMMSGVALLFVIVLFFFSMAACLRYVYISVCMVFACHAFAIKLLKDVNKKEN
jgi:hypothetical protein